MNPRCIHHICLAPTLSFISFSFWSREKVGTNPHFFFNPLLDNEPSMGLALIQWNPDFRTSKETDNWFGFTVKQTQQRETGFQTFLLIEGFKKRGIPQNKSPFFSVNWLLLVLLSYLLKKYTLEIQKRTRSNLFNLLIWSQSVVVITENWRKKFLDSFKMIKIAESYNCQLFRAIFLYHLTIAYRQ